MADVNWKYKVLMGEVRQNGIDDRSFVHPLL